MDINKELWEDWKNHVVTKAFMDSLRDKINDGRDLLEQTDDNIVRGYIKACRDMLDITFEERVND